MIVLVNLDKKCFAHKFIGLNINYKTVLFGLYNINVTGIHTVIWNKSRERDETVMINVYRQWCPCDIESTQYFQFIYPIQTQLS